LPAIGVVAAVLGGLGTAGCSYQLQSLTAKDIAKDVAKDDPDVETTGSISRPSGQSGRSAEVTASAEVDLAYARAAAADALARSDKGVSVPWQNPNTGAGGNITPLASSYSEGGMPCRDFLASYVHGASQDWLQGAACRSSAGKWEVRSLKPLKRS
jgi:surface antigen